MAEETTTLVGSPLHINTANTNYVVRETMLQGKKHLIVPIVMMVEGVHNGSRGPLLHPAEELGKFPEAWNGIPIVIDHPVNNEGINISANSPEVLEQAVGKVLNSHMQGTKLMADGYVDPEKLQAVSPNAYTAIINGQPLEVSIGAFTEEEGTSGVWNNERYNAIARGHRPDHLALLPGGIGACSWNDGCGIRANSLNKKKEGGKENMDNTQVTGYDEKKKDHIQSVLDVNMDQGYKKKVESAQRMLDAMDSQTISHYLEDMSDDFIVYSVRDVNSPRRKMLKSQYTMGNNGVPAFTGDPQEVRQKIEYVPIVNGGQQTVNKKGGNQMSAKPECGKCMEKVIAIINSNSTQFTAEDREWLLTQEEAVLDKLMPKASEKPIEVNTAQAPKPIEVLSDEDKADLAWAKRMRQERRQTLIQGIQANTSKELWPEAELLTMSESFLEKLHNSVVEEDVTETNQVANYALNGNTRRSVTEDVIPMYPTGIEVETKK